MKTVTRSLSLHIASLAAYVAGALHALNGNSVAAGIWMGVGLLASINADLIDR